MDLPKIYKDHNIIYKTYSEWRLFTDNEFFEDNLDKLNEEDPESAKYVDKILDDIKLYPFQGKFHQHPLWQFKPDRRRGETGEFVVWSAEIPNSDHRVNYFIDKLTNVIIVTNCYQHYVMDKKYSDWLQSQKNFHACLYF